MKKAVLLVFLSLMLCSCAATAPKEVPTSTSPILSQTLAPSATRPVAVVTIQKTKSGEELMAYSLNDERITYPRIPVVRNTELRGSAAIDSTNALYIVYGARENYLSKLEPNGAVSTVELPIWWPFHAIWAGDKLLVVPDSTSSETYIVDTNLKTTTIPEALNALPDGTQTHGTFGLANSDENVGIWVALEPIRQEDGDYAFYRTVNGNTGEMKEEMLKIPSSSPDWGPSNDPDMRSGTIVYGVDAKTKNVMLCYGYSAPEAVQKTILEFYSPVSGETIAQEERCCLNNIFDLRGETYIENQVPEACSYSIVRNLADNQPAFDVELYVAEDERGSLWLRSNGRYWMLLTDKHAVVIDEAKQFEASYPMPAEFPQGLIPGDTIEAAFAITY